MSRQRGHVVVGYRPDQGYPFGYWNTVAAAEKWVTDSLTIPIGEVVSFRIKDVEAPTLYTKASQT